MTLYVCVCNAHGEKFNRLYNLWTNYVTIKSAHSHRLNADRTLDSVVNQKKKKNESTQKVVTHILVESLQSELEIDPKSAVFFMY